MKLLKLVPENTNIDFMRWRRFAIIGSMVLSIAAIILTGTRGLNLGVDFVGGQMVRTTFEQPINIDRLRSDIGGLRLGDASIQEFGGPTSYQIRLPMPPGGDEAANVAAQQVRAMLDEKYPGARIDAVETVSGKVSEELAFSGAMAIGLAMLAIAIYIWFRFEWQFGVGALITLFHDITMTLGLFSLTQLQFDLNVVAAFLTIVGYSLNDTVVIYDRIRENLRKYRKMAIVPLINLSLNETLARTVVTSLTLLIALAALLVIGPEVIFGLALAIAFGILIGTYSSIYISAPVLVWLGVKPDSFLRFDEGDTPPRPQEG
ncbi:MAG TPA: protein translocase subunit SecF [Sphingomicrobium sp.]|nr:protein translocase subunit SecF [Sphingomicrobium sp.]